MHDQTPKDNANPGYETQGVQTRGIWWFAAGLLWFIIAVMVLLGGLYAFLERQARRDAPAVPPERIIPPEPRLQTDPATDMRALREREAALLEEYGWIDEQQGVVRIPIERAMQIVAERGAAHGAPLEEFEPADAAPMPAPDADALDGPPENGGQDTSDGYE